MTGEPLSMPHCGRFIPAPLSRREMLLRCANGFGAVALAGLLDDRAYGASPSLASTDSSPFAARPPHRAPKARNVIFLYMDGGPSQVDTFDPKPLLDKENGQPFKM